MYVIKIIGHWLNDTLPWKLRDMLECIANVVVSDCQMAPLYGTWTCPKVSIGDN